MERVASVQALMLLADGRFPTGGHAHSGGMESAVADGRVHDEDSLEAFLRGRLVTAGRVDAALAAAAAGHLAEATGEERRQAVLRLLDAEAAARITVAPLRAVSRRLGRQLVRAATRCWPEPVLASVAACRDDGVHQPVALGAVGLAAGIAPLDVARLAVHHVATTPAAAAVRLLGMDPLAVAAIVARLGDLAEEVAVDAARWAATAAPAELPAHSGPLADLAAAAHPRRPVRLFAS
jgi:urease accessory protein